MRAEGSGVPVSKIPDIGCRSNMEPFALRFRISERDDRGERRVRSPIGSMEDWK